ncbi:hypothetical protein PIECOFPK_01849 [Mycovorax composti]|uniref:DUF2071 domain-containing protein n=1 Tax=Mycovorax composti TaxID=2962693 RepID=A0ABZ2EL62_9BACT
MSNISEILKSTAHRPYEYPERPWWYYQEWNRALLLHYEVPYELLKKLVPKGLDIDTFNGKAYISIIPFTMERLRPRLQPSLSWISNFQEINVRTYMEVGNKKGVYFLNIEAGKYLSAILTRKLSKLPYEKANIKREGTTYYSKNSKKGFWLDVAYTVGETIQQKSELDIWLTERYCLYLKSQDTLYRYDVHHREWELKEVTVTRLDIHYPIGELLLNYPADLTHYSNGVQVLIWDKVKI